MSKKYLKIKNKLLFLNLQMNTFDTKHAKKKNKMSPGFWGVYCNEALKGTYLSDSGFMLIVAVSGLTVTLEICLFGLTVK